MKSRIWTTALTLLIAASFVLAACAPAATPTAAPQPTQAPVQPVEPTQAPAPAEPTAAPTQAPEPTVAAGPKTGGRITVMDSSGFYTLDPFQTPWFTLTQGAIYDTLVTPNLELTRLRRHPGKGLESCRRRPFADL